MSTSGSPLVGGAHLPDADRTAPATAPPAAGGAGGGTGAESVPSPFASLGAGFDRALTRGLRRVTGSAVAPYQSAIVRIGFGLTWMLFLLREFPHRQELYGPNGPWGFDLAKRLLSSNHAFSVLMWSDSRGWFELVYAVAVVSSATLMLGYRTRTSSLLFMVGVLSLQNRSIFVGDGGDNVIHIMAIYLAFTRCGQVWSLDRRLAARRAARQHDTDAAADAGSDAGSDADSVAASESGTGPGSGVRSVRDGSGVDPVGIALWAVLGAALVAASAAGKLSTGWAVIFWLCWLGQALWWAVRRYAPGEPKTLMEVLGDIVHNGAMLVIVAEVCLIYSTAGWYKIQGSRWEDGTALYYPLHLDDFTPWPALSHALAGNDVMVMLITYGTVIVQVAFPFTLFNRRVKNVLLAGMMVEHASIAIVLGLPFFSLAMIAADAVFLPTGFLRWAGQEIGRAVRPRRTPAAAVIRPRTPDPAETLTPGQASGAAAEPAAGPTPPSTAVT